jgi:hypothetical protein
VAHVNLALALTDATLALWAVNKRRRGTTLWLTVPLLALWLAAGVPWGLALSRVLWRP